jgi:hypothetical protein
MIVRLSKNIFVNDNIDFYGKTQNDNENAKTQKRKNDNDVPQT